MKDFVNTFLRGYLVGCILWLCAVGDPGVSQTVPTINLSDYIGVPLVYEFKPAEVGLLARYQFARIPKLGCDIDTLAGLGIPTKQLSLGGKSLSDLTGQAGIGASWSWSWPKKAYKLRIGAGVLELAGGQPEGSVYILVSN